MYFLVIPIIAIIIYKHNSSNFNEATTDDGDNEFEQLDNDIKKVEDLINIVESNKKDEHEFFIDNLRSK